MSRTTSLVRSHYSIYRWYKVYPATTHIASQALRTQLQTRPDELGPVNAGFMSSVFNGDRLKTSIYSGGKTIGGNTQQRASAAQRRNYSPT